MSLSCRKQSLPFDKKFCTKLTDRRGKNPLSQVYITPSVRLPCISSGSVRLSKPQRLLLSGLTLCYLAAETVAAQPAPSSPPNADPDRLRAIVQAEPERPVRRPSCSGCECTTARS